jgi:hypothetical protein
MSNDEVHQIEKSMVRIETKLDIALGRQSDHETRLRCLEKRIWFISGGAVLIWALERSVPFLKP